MSHAQFVYAFSELCKGACVLGGLREVDKTYELLRGVPRAASFPVEARFDMNVDFGIKLQDVLRNSDQLLVVSEKLRDRLANAALKNVELLPVAIHDTKGRSVKASFFIVHTTVLQDCLDLAKTVGDRNPINPDLFLTMDALVVDETRIDPDVSVFRPAHYPNILLVRRDLAESILAEGFTGIAFDEVDAYDEFQRL